MDKKTPLTPVFVIWEDAYSIDEWTNISEIKSAPCATVYTCGLLVEQNQKQVVITLNHDISNDNISCVMVIPREMIRAIVKLDKEPEKKVDPQCSAR